MRRKHDAYYTPTSAVHELQKHWMPSRELKLIEPCVGDGAIIEEFPKHIWDTNDINPRFEADYNLDAKEPELWNSIDLNNSACITNPPFSAAFEILQQAMKCDVVAMLLRLSFLEPTRKRSEYLRLNPPKMIIVLPRISFTGNGKTDSVTCAWMLWGNSVPNKIIVSERN